MKRVILGTLLIMSLPACLSSEDAAMTALAQRESVNATLGAEAAAPKETQEAAQTGVAVELTKRPAIHVTPPTRSTILASSSSSRTWVVNCSDWYDGETDEFIAWAKGPGKIDVYGGVDEPRTNDIKGTISADAAFRVECKSGSWYRVRGVNWWGFLKISDTYE